MPRYDGREIITTNKYDFYKILNKRNRQFVQHYDTAKYNVLSEEDKALLTGDIHIWQYGDKYYKLSLQYYGTIDEWPIIALHNQKPTEFHVNIGDEIEIPLPLSLAKELYGL